MGHTVKKEFAEAKVSYKRGGMFFMIPRLGDATEQQLEELAKLKHPGVTKTREVSSSKEEKKS